MAQRPLTVTAVTQHIKPEIYANVDDEATIILTYPKAQAILQASWNWPFDRKDMEVYGQTGYVITVRRDDVRVRAHEDKEEAQVTAAPLSAPYDDSLSYLRAVVLDGLQPEGLPRSKPTSSSPRFSTPPAARRGKGRRCIARSVTCIRVSQSLCPLLTFLLICHPMHAAALIAGVLIILSVLLDAFETVVLPRRVHRQFRITSWFYRNTWSALGAVGQPHTVADPARGFPGILRSALVDLSPGLWACGLIFGFALLQYGGGEHLFSGNQPITFGLLLYHSGETFFTLGYGDIIPNSGFSRALSVGEAGMGFGFLGVVIGYLPTIYSSFSRREIEISLLDARAGSPPTAAELLPAPPAVRTSAVSTNSFATGSAGPPKCSKAIFRIPC